MSSIKCIIVSHKRDWTSNVVIDWLKYYKVNYYFLHELNYEKSKFTVYLSPSIGKIYFSIGNQQLSKNTHFWIRKSPKLYSSMYLSAKLNHQVTSFISQEQIAVFRYISSVIRNSYKHLGSNSQYNTPMEVNKLECLIQASRLHLKIPRTTVTNSKTEVQRFLDKCRSAIFKPLSEAAMVAGKASVFTMHTNLIDNSLVSSLADDNFPILLQEYIDKKFEIRVFVIYSKLYAAAIFSQNDKQTQIDYRRYNDDKPNRMVPFELPIIIAKRCLNLVKVLGLNTCSIDLIYTPKDEYYFLEVNPVGQFGAVSFNCNYYIEELVAKKLGYGND